MVNIDITTDIERSLDEGDAHVTDVKDVLPIHDPAPTSAAEFIDGLSRLWNAEWAEIGNRAARFGVSGWRWDQAWETATEAGGLEAGMVALQVARRAGAGARACAAAAGAAAALAARPSLDDRAFQTLYGPFWMLMPIDAGGSATESAGAADHCWPGGVAMDELRLSRA